MDKFQDAKLFFEKGIKAYLSKDMELSESFFLKTLECAPESIPTLENLSKIWLQVVKLLGEFEIAVSLTRNCFNNRHFVYSFIIFLLIFIFI